MDIKDEVDPAYLPNADSAHTPFRYKDLPVKADTKARTLDKSQINTATTNQELVDYAERLQSEDHDSSQNKKRGLFARRKAK
ncbi:hypothetical protein PKHYL_12630 [Psychrobacter sp. KH172YL61]|nr:hypothetical protein [Psychrobacter sp. KH172YL61]BBI67072.1 hypothetical protein PKHYL_12630 [Psychrobacter sp. KH172YL61]